MKKRFAIATSCRAAALLLGAVGCLALGLASAPVRADQCPRGQFFWKTKKSCIDKAEAAKLGMYHGPVPTQDKANAKAAPEKPADEPTGDAPASDAVVAPPAATPDATPQAAPAEQADAAPPKASPYGELAIEDFAKAK